MSRADEILKRSSAISTGLKHAFPTKTQTASISTTYQQPQLSTAQETIKRHTQVDDRGSYISNYSDTANVRKPPTVAPIDVEVSKAKSIMSRVEQALQKSAQIKKGDADYLNGQVSRHVNLPQARPQEEVARRDERGHSSGKYRDHSRDRYETENRSGHKEKRNISPGIATAYDEALKRSQEVIRRNEEELDRTRDLERSRKTSKERPRESNLKNSHVVERRANGRPSPPEKEDSEQGYERAEVPAPGIYIQQHMMIKPKFVEEYYEDGTVYIGEKIKDSKQGRGEYQYIDGTKYNGEWENDQKSGYGVQLFANENIQYDGEWKNDLYHGNGILMNEDAEKHDGFDFKNFDSLENNWIKYEGEFMAGKMHGLGTLTLFSNERFVGKFKYDKVHGAGVFHRSDGDSTSAEWDNNRLARLL